MRKIYYGRIAARRFCYIAVAAEWALKYTCLNAIRVTELAILAGDKNYKQIAKEAYEPYRWIRKLILEFVHIKLYDDLWFTDKEWPYNFTMEELYNGISEEAEQKRQQLDAEGIRK